ncbi:MerR family transcriptional regulator [Ktedonobacter racemifer]|uniref:Transcriptional activator ligand binding domain protein n=1 Tax=Ktedonobacter racemifer DSM 44963 TaxID=485913 RepID=D6TC85_KTERA|nr:MerR family transcriptional regulator [Ktedonobacter racemifer]EFH88121.1 transcriptional activator ligand binding domain protein [Ktedonobacter racemifer DSM 44963]
MIRIGDFSKLSQVSIKTLRYYDEMGLLKPLNVDRFTGYRYYSVSQLPRLNRILALKDLGFELSQIAQVVGEGVSSEQLRGMLRLKYAELQQQIADSQERLARIEARLNDIEREDTLPNYDVVLKQADAQLVAGVRDTLSNYPEVGRLLNKVYDYLARSGVNGLSLTGAAIWHDDEYKTGDIDGEAVVYLKQPVPADGHVKVYELPEALVASVIHKGAYNKFSQAYEALGHWIEANGYTVVGPNREIYLECLEPVRQDDDSYVTEIQFPIAKKEPDHS